MDRNVAILVINLAYRTDRRSEMEVQLRRIGWSAEFFPAVRPDEAGGFPSIGARGCFLSHLAVLKIARDRHVSKLIILEDDLNFVDGFRERWDELLATLDSVEWSIAYAGHLLVTASVGWSTFNFVANCHPVYRHFMIINGSAIETLIEGLEMILVRPPGDPLGGPMHVDGAYSTLRAQNANLNTYFVSPPRGYQRSSRTDIGDVKWFDRFLRY